MPGRLLHELRPALGKCERGAALLTELPDVLWLLCWILADHRVLVHGVSSQLCGLRSIGIQASSSAVLLCSDSCSHVQLQRVACGHLPCKANCTPALVLFDALHADSCVAKLSCASGVFHTRSVTLRFQQQLHLSNCPAVQAAALCTLPSFEKGVEAVSPAL